ncbi:uncharacterized protein L199_007108 [Kwoniella botswanensis]|uniref:uncharacterized protein n=1 Tax=Kwoniella botswanensis TaxID=1268659 RepID=UPI00315D83A7
MSSNNDRYDKTMRSLAAAMGDQDRITHPRGFGRNPRQRRRAADSQDEQSRQAIYSATQYTYDIERQNEAERQTTQSAQDAGAANVGAPQDAEDTESWAGDSTTPAGTETPPSEDEDGSNTPLEGSILPLETGPISEDGSHAGTEATPPHSEDSTTLFGEFAQRSDHGSESGPDAGFQQGPGPHRFNVGDNNYYVGHIGPHARVRRVDNTQDVTRQINDFFGSSRGPAASGSTAQRSAPTNDTRMPQQSTNSRSPAPSGAPDTAFHSVFGEILNDRIGQLQSARSAQEPGRNTYNTDRIGGNATVQMGTRNGETGVFWGRGGHSADQAPSQPGTATQPNGDTGIADASSSPAARGNYRRPAVEEGSDNGA